MLARLFETVVWYESGLFATQLVDPVTLSYRKLKTILECRGLGYSGLEEKKDVSDLLEKSGKAQENAKHNVPSFYRYQSYMDKCMGLFSKCCSSLYFMGREEQCVYYCIQFVLPR